MSDGASLVLYSLVIAAGALAGAAYPLLRSPPARHTRVLLSLSAGVMLGAAFFHMLPEAIHLGGLPALGWTIPGFLFLFLLERYVLVHWCEEPEEQGCEVHGFHAHPGGTAAAEHDAPHGTVGLAAFVGLTVHTLVDGLALGSAVGAGVGGSVFIAILMHKSPSSFALATILRHEHFRTGTILALSLAFAGAVPMGVAIYYAIAGQLDGRFPPAALAFSAGSFLHLAVADLIPDLHRERQQRGVLSVALVAGVGLMWALTALAPEHHH
jgi:zinc and cadmium transporter